MRWRQPSDVEIHVLAVGVPRCDRRPTHAPGLFSDPLLDGVQSNRSGADDYGEPEIKTGC